MFLICIFLVYENKFSCKTLFSCWLTLLKICQNTVFSWPIYYFLRAGVRGGCAAHQNLRLNDLKYIAVDEFRLSFVNSYSRQETNFLPLSHCWYFFMLLLKIYANFQSRSHRILYKKKSLSKASLVTVAVLKLLKKPSALESAVFFKHSYVPKSRISSGQYNLVPSQHLLFYS